MATSVSSLAERTAKLVDVVSQHADESDGLGRSAPPIVDALVQSGIAEMLWPESWGGENATLTDCMDVHGAIAEADASAGWVAVAATSFPVFIRGISREIQDEIRATNPCLGAGSVTPAGRAEVVEGGYMVEGTWPFATGCHHSTWLYGNCLVVRDGAPVLSEAGTPTARFAFFRAEKAEILNT
jgi:alkylation response protein AidB-like acyl-CoA dehydrogenase